MSVQLPTYFLRVVFAGWLNRQQQAVIEFLKTENEILKSQLKGRRLRLSDEDHRRLAEKGRALGRKLLAEVACIVTPETILAWHRNGANYQVNGTLRGSWRAKRDRQLVWPRDQQLRFVSAESPQ